MPTRMRIHIDVDLFRAICSYSYKILVHEKLLIYLFREAKNLILKTKFTKESEKNHKWYRILTVWIREQILIRSCSFLFEDANELIRLMARCVHLACIVEIFNRNRYVYPNVVYNRIPRSTSKMQALIKLILLREFVIEPR